MNVTIDATPLLVRSAGVKNTLSLDHGSKPP